MQLQTSPASSGRSTRAQRGRAALTVVLLLLVASMLYIARRALMPLAVGTVFAYVMLPLINWLDARIRPTFHQRHALRSLLVLIVYLLTITVLIVSLAAIIPPIGGTNAGADAATAHYCRRGLPRGAKGRADLARSIQRDCAGNHPPGNPA